jgi:hypothetical protein
MDARLRPLALCAAVALACAGTSVPEGPVLVAMDPSQGTALEPLAVEIAGERFDADVRTDFGGAGSVDARFSARLAPVGGGGPVELLDVRLTSHRTLRATVPAGIAPGAYDLVVKDPRGRKAVLPRAFRVVTDAENVAAFRVDVLEAPRAGVAFAVSLTAVDGGGLTVDGFDGSVTVDDLTGTVGPTSLGPFTLGRFQGLLTVSALTAADRLTVVDGLGHGGASDLFDVVAGPPVAVAFAEPPVVAASGGCSPPVELELRDALGHPTPAEHVLAAEVHSSPPGLELFADGACSAPLSSLAFAAGASRAAFRFRGGAPGAIALRVVPSSLPSAAQAATVTP